MNILNDDNVHHIQEFGLSDLCDDEICIIFTFQEMKWKLGVSNKRFYKILTKSPSVWFAIYDFWFELCIVNKNNWIEFEKLNGDEVFQMIYKGLNKINTSNLRVIEFQRERIENWERVNKIIQKYNREYLEKIRRITKKNGNVKNIESCNYKEIHMKEIIKRIFFVINYHGRSPIRFSERNYIEGKPHVDPFLLSQIISGDCISYILSKCPSLEVLDMKGMKKFLILEDSVCYKYYNLIFNKYRSCSRFQTMGVVLKILDDDKYDPQKDKELSKTLASSFEEWKQNYDEMFIKLRSKFVKKVFCNTVYDSIKGLKESKLQKLYLPVLEYKQRLHSTDISESCIFTRCCRIVDIKFIKLLQKKNISCNLIYKSMKDIDINRSVLYKSMMNRRNFDKNIFVYLRKYEICGHDKVRLEKGASKIAVKLGSRNRPCCICEYNICYECEVYTCFDCKKNYCKRCFFGVFGKCHSSTCTKALTSVYTCRNCLVECSKCSKWSCKSHCDKCKNCNKFFHCDSVFCDICGFNDCFDCSKLKVCDDCVKYTCVRCCKECINCRNLFCKNCEENHSMKCICDECKSNFISCIINQKNCTFCNKLNCLTCIAIGKEEEEETNDLYFCHKCLQEKKIQKCSKCQIEYITQTNGKSCHICKNLFCHNCFSSCSNCQRIFCQNEHQNILKECICGSYVCIDCQKSTCSICNGILCPNCVIEQKCKGKKKSCQNIACVICYHDQFVDGKCKKCRDQVSKKIQSK